MHVSHIEISADGFQTPGVRYESARVLQGSDLGHFTKLVLDDSDLAFDWVRRGERKQGPGFLTRLLVKVHTPASVVLRRVGPTWPRWGRMDVEFSLEAQAS